MVQSGGKTGGLLRQISGVSRPESESADARERRLWPQAVRVEPLRFRRAPLLAAAVCFALGEACTKIPPATHRLTLLLVAGVVGLAALTVLALRRSLRSAVLAIAGVWIGAGVWSAQIQPTPAPQTALLAYADGLSRTVQGRIVRIRTFPSRAETAESDFDPEQWDQPGAPSTSLDLDLTAIEEVTPDISRMIPISGGVRATLFADRHSQPLAQSPAQLGCGVLVELPLRVRIPERYRDPGVWQYADFLLDQNIAATASASATKLRAIPNAAAVPLSATLQCRLFAAQSWAAARLLGYVRSTPNRRLPALLRITPDDAGMLNAMLFGDRSRLNHTLRLGFERTGSFHLFVVSGMHVALLAGIIFWIARRLRLRQLLATALTLTLVFGYALLTGFGVPVQRALLMTAVFLIANLLSRDRNRLNALGAAALSVLIWSPRALFDASFQMTFLAIVAIAGIAMPLGERSFLQYARASRNLNLWGDRMFPPHLAQFRMMLRWWSEACAEALGSSARRLPSVLIRTPLRLAELALIGIVAEAVMILPMATYFHRATVFALPANSFSIPLVAVLAPLGILTFVASLISPWLAALPASALAILLHAITTLIQRISNAPAADLRVPGPTIAHALLALTCFAFCCWAVRRTHTLAWIAVLVLPIAATIILWPSPPAVHHNEMEVTAIDVGQGDSLLVVSPNGNAMLIDAGGPTGAAANAENASATAASFDVGEEVVSPYLWSRQFRRLDVVALTHAHSDHMGGMPAVLRNFRPRELWVAVDPNSAPYRALLDEAASLGIRVRHLRAGERIPWDGTDVSVLAPMPMYDNPGLPINNDSLVMRMQFGQSSALLEGDAEGASEHLMAASALSGSGPAIGPDTLLKVGHHGSRTSSTEEFLALAAPQDAVISVGRNNTFGHPRPEIVQRLAAGHARVFRTDEFGLTTFLLSRNGSIAALPPTSN